MRTLTKTGIRILSAKYRSILIKCAIINASVFIGAFGANPVMADSWYVSDWNNFKNAVNNAIPDHLNIDIIKIQGSGITYQDIPNNINRTLDVLGYQGIKELNGANTFQGFLVDAGGNLTLENITMKNFYSNNGAAIFNQAEADDNISIINKITGNFIDNVADSTGGAIYNGSANTAAKIGDIVANFTNNYAGEGGAIYNYASSEVEAKATIDTITGDFVNNHAKKGGAIYNYGYDNPETKIGYITGNFINNYASSYDAETNGGAIYNTGSGIIENITGDFINNSALATDLITFAMGGAIYNTGDGIIKNITGDFKSNFAKSYGGAIYNNNNSSITISTSPDKKNIIFDGNYVITDMGGAIYNNGTISLYADAGQSITFVGGEDVIDTEHPENSKYDIDGIFNVGILNINGNGTKTYNGTVNLYTVSDNSIPMGTTNIYGGTVNANANIEQDIINVKSGATLASNTAGVEIKADGTNGNLINDGTINITGANSRFGADHLTNNATINITGANSLLETATLTNNGTMDIVSLLSNSLNNNGNITTSGGIEAIIQNNEGGSITFNGDNGKLIILTNSGTVNFNGRLDTGNSVIQLVEKDGGIMNFSTNAIESTANLPISVFYLNGGSVNIADGRVNTLHINQLNLAGNTNFAIDADLADDGQMDQLKVASVSGNGNIVISDIKLLSDANDDYVELSLFADDNTKTLLANNVSGNLNGLKYSTIYKYDALYNPETGTIGFTRTEQLNPYIYAPSVAAQATANITGQIATLVMDKMDDIIRTQGRSGGDTPSSANAWVKVMGLDDNVEFQDFDTIDSKALTVAGGFNTDKITCGDCGAVFGVYAGYIGGKQQYTDNDTDQDGGYVGLSSALTLGNAFLTATVNGGLLKNKSTNMYGTDEFKTLWLGTGLKTGYNYAINDSVVLQPNVYGGYTLVNTQDYTSVSGVKIANNNLNFFEIDPGLKLSAIIADGWTGSVQGKYAIVMDNGGDITANDIILQNISTKNYFEYGIGIDKSLTDAFYLGAKINRRDGGRTGWNGSIEFKYKF